MTPLRPLLEHLIDYAGLFPPSALPMARAVENYLRYRESPESWMLARFVVPVSRLDEFESCAPPHSNITLSVLASPNLDADISRIACARFPIDTIELKAEDTAQIESMMRRIPARLTAYIETGDAALIPAIHAAGARAKMRTGGVTPEAIPPPARVARFIEICAATATPFKATAGLHHPLRCFRPLTYSEGGPSGWMFGFLNVFIAAALALKGERAQPALVEETFSDHGLTAEDFAAARKFAISFGSCSFEEPVEDLRSLHLL